MNIYSDLIKTERRKRAWSQDHLAQVSGLGLRTIQRIETGNSASFDSIRAIAASFDIEPHVLIVDNQSTPSTQRYPFSPLAVFSLFCAVLTGFGLALASKQTFADQIMLDVGIVLNSESEQKGSLLTRDGKDAEMRLDDILRFVVTPAIQEDGRIFLATRIYQFKNGNYRLISEPELLTQNNKEAEIGIKMDNGDSVRFHITPHVD